MTREELEKYIDKSEELNEVSRAKLKEVTNQFPFFHTAHLLLAKNRYLLSPQEFENYIHEASTFSVDRKKLFYLINSDKYNVFFEPDETTIDMDRTETLLDSFLTNFIDEENKENIITKEEGIVSTDYLSYLEKTKQDLGDEDGNTPHLKHQNIIDSFLKKAESDEVLFTPPKESTKITKSTEAEKEAESGGFLTETLARIYVKQKNYEQALTIIQQLSLNFPKKSSYFADQIRFLELLILNEKNKKQ